MKTNFGYSFQDIYVGPRSDSHVAYSSFEDGSEKITKYYWKLSPEDIKRYAVLQNYISSFGSGIIEVSDQEKEYIIKVDFLKLNGEGFQVSYLYHKNGGKKKVQNPQTLTVCEQEYVGGKRGYELEPEYQQMVINGLGEDFLNGLISELGRIGIIYKYEWFSSANVKFFINGENIRMVITDMSTTIKDTLKENQDFINSLLISN